MSDSEVVFRHIGGRVVPIRVGKVNAAIEKRSKKIQGVGLEGAAVVVAGAAGGTAARVTKKSYEFRVKSNIMHENFKAAGVAAGYGKGKKLNQAAIKLRAMSKNMFIARHAILAAGVAGSTYLFTKGMNKLREAKGEEPIDKKKAGEAAFRASVLTFGAYYHQLPIKSVTKVAQNINARVKGKPRPHKPDWFK